jgi:hypothetical protein
MVAKATDPAGYNGPASTVFSFTIDTVAPASPKIGSAVLRKNGTYLLTGTAEANASVSVHEGATLLGTATADGKGSWSFSTGRLSGVMTFNATASDAAGNVAPSSGLAVHGTIGNNTLKSGSGDDLLIGAGGTDSFVFAMDFGKDRIPDFVAGTRSGYDVLAFSRDVFATTRDALNSVRAVGSDVVIAVQDDVITLNGVQKSALVEANFLIY